MRAIKKINYISVIIFVLLSINLTAQQRYSTTKKSAIKQFEIAQNNYNAGDYKDAISNLNLALKKDANFIEPYLLKAQIYSEINDIENEIKEYENALAINREYTPKIQYLLSIAYFNNEEYQKSLDICLEARDMDISSNWLSRSIDTGIEAAHVALDLYNHPVPFNPINLGEKVNTRFDDYWPMLSTDGTKLYTTKTLPRRDDMPMSRRNSQEDFFINFLEKDSSWSRPYKIGALNTKTNEGAPSISADGQTFVFTACNRKDGFGKCDIYISKRTKNGWTRPRNIGEPINTKVLERQPSLSPDGKTIYFTSDRRGTSGVEDIWVSHLQENEKWSTPINLGDSINTDGLEWAPFIHPDGRTLYFVSNGHMGMGGLDIFKSIKTNDTTWSKPINIGYPINTAYDEQSLFVSVEGDLGLISSNRAHDENGLDIYSFELPQAARPGYVSYIAGIVSDSKNGIPLEATIELIDLHTGEHILQPESEAETGKYLLCLPADKEYMLNISKEGYLPYSMHFALKDESKQKPLTKNILLTPIELNAEFILKNIFFETDSYELKSESKIELAKLLQFLNKNPSISLEISGHTDNQGSKEHNIKLSDNRAKTVYDYLIVHDVVAERLTYKGYGFAKPLDSNDTEVGRANNRRTEFKIIKL